MTQTRKAVVKNAVSELYVIAGLIALMIAFNGQVASCLNNLLSMPFENY
jgi:hypothetical protein